MAGFIGEIFGIRFDIRHITISAGNVTLAVYGLGFANLRTWYLVTVLLGVLGIGFLNFLVSFSLAFIVAARPVGSGSGNILNFWAFSGGTFVAIRWILSGPRSAEVRGRGIK
jgi:site-specific recombinase